MANRDLNKLFKKAFKGAGELNVLNLRSLLSHMIEKVEEAISKQVPQHHVESLEREIIQNREELQSLRETLEKYPDPDQLREDLQSLRETPKKYPDQDREELRSLRETPPKNPEQDQAVKEVRALREKLPEMLNNFVTLDVMESALQSETQSLREELLNSGPVDPGDAQTEPPEIPSEKLSEVNSSLESLVSETSQHRALIESLVDESSQRKALVESLVNESGQLRALTESLVNETSQLRALTESLVNESTQHRALIDDLTVKHDSLEDMFLNQRPETETTSATSGSLDAHREASRELRQQMSSLRTSVNKQKEDIKKLSAKVTLCEERNAHQDLQDKMDMTENTVKCPQDEAEQDESEDRYASTTDLEEIESKIKFLFQLHERLQEEVKRLVCKETVRDTENVEGITRVQNAILQLESKLQSYFDKLNGDTKNLEGKVSRQHSDFVSKQSKLTVEMESKVTKADVNSILKRQLKQHEMPQGGDDAAGLRKPLGERFQCLSCDKPVLKHTPRPAWMQKPSYPRFPPLETTGSCTVPAPEQCNRNQDPETPHYISEVNSTGVRQESFHVMNEQVSRNCSRKPTLAPASQQGTVNTDVRPHTQTVAKGKTQGVVHMAGRNCDACEPVSKIELPQIVVKPLTILPPIQKKIQPNRTNASASKKKAGDTGRM